MIWRGPRDFAAANHPELGFRRVPADRGDKNPDRHGILSPSGDLANVPSARHRCCAAGCSGRFGYARIALAVMTTPHQPANLCSMKPRKCHHGKFTPVCVAGVFAGPAVSAWQQFGCRRAPQAARGQAPFFRLHQPFRRPKTGIGAQMAVTTGIPRRPGHPASGPAIPSTCRDSVSGGPDPGHPDRRAHHLRPSGPDMAPAPSPS